MPFSTYDRLFRRLFGDAEAAADLARNALPQELLRRIDLSSAEVIEGSFVDEQLRGHQTDLLVRFRSSGGREIYLYVLVEHKSSPDRWAALQMLRYVVRVYQKLLEKETSRKRLPKVVPLLLYHGSRRWRYALSLESHIEGKREDAHTPRFTPILYDLRNVRRERVSGAVHTAVGLLCLKYIQQRFSRKIVRLLLDELHRLPQDERSRRYTEAFYAAIVRLKEQEEIDLFVAQARAMRYRDSEEAVMTYGEKLLKEGLEKGLEKGKLREKQEVLRRLMSKKFELSHEEASVIEHTEDIHALDAALDEIVMAESKEQVLEHLKSSEDE
jgi:predicted transposase/invertase (TIGR01784 family)